MDYNKLTKKELIAKSVSLKKEINKYQFDIKSGDLKEVNEYRKAKKDLAVILTIIRETELGIRKENAVKAVKKEVKAEKAEKKTKKVKK